MYQDFEGDFDKLSNIKVLAGFLVFEDSLDKLHTF